MKRFLLLSFFFLIHTTLCFAQQKSQQPDLYAIAKLPTPVLNTPDFSFVFGNKDGKTLHLDETGLIREVEFIAFPKTVFTIEKTIHQGTTTLYQITTLDYPYPTQKGYFIDSRFVHTTDQKLPPRKKDFPDKKFIISRLQSSEGSR